MKAPLSIYALAAVLLAACSSSTAVGSDLVNISDQGNVDRVGAIDQFEEPSAQPSEVGPTTSPTVSAPESASPTPDATPSPQPATEPEYEPVVIEITVDGFAPLHQRVWVGTEVRFVNNDQVERRVTGLDAAYDSGPIQPGGTASFVTDQIGEFSFQDETRVYYVVQLEVLQP